MILNTQQIILLCLLVSFVTATATGITVVSLMQQAPEPVTQTINRVVERTVETVTQQPIEEIKDIVASVTSPDSTPPQREVVTVVVNQEDQTINAVEKNERSIVRIVRDNQAEDFTTLGIILNKEGDVLVDRRTINTVATYKGVYARGSFLLRIDNEFSHPNFAIFKITENSPGDFVPVTLGNSDNLKLAQSVISLSGSQSNSVAIGEVAALIKDSEGQISSIRTSVNPNNVLTGSVILNLNGSVVGFRANTPEDRTVFVPINTIKSILGI